jgi:cell wall-associated NlpC family hydrolase
VTDTRYRFKPGRARAAALVCLALAAVGCTPFRAGLPSTSVPAPGTAASQAGDGIARAAATQLGAPYRYGGMDPTRGFDCSGLVFYAHAQQGVAVPRTAAEQFAAARRVDLDDLEPGDLVFYRLVPRLGDVTHVGIYVGQGRFVHAPQSGKRVGEARLDDPYWRERFAGAGRLYPNGSGAGPRLE